MLNSKLLFSYTFRFMWGYVVALSVATVVMVMAIHTYFSYGFYISLGDAIEDEMAAFEQTYSGNSLDEVNAYISERADSNWLFRYSYLILDREQNKIAGNLDEIPQNSRPHKGGWLRFHADLLNSYFIDFGSMVPAYVIKLSNMPNGDVLLVARSSNESMAIASAVMRALMQTMVVTILLGSVGGAIIARKSFQQIDKVNRSLKKIMTGNLSERIDVVHYRGEINQLAFSINLMLEKIESLMEGVKQVSDNIAHDLRTPLTRLRNHLCQLQERVDNANDAEAVGELIDEADALLSTFNALLRIARIESGNRRSGFAPLDLKIILQDVVELYEPLALDKSISMHYDFEDQLITNGDRDLLFQALANLVDNAIKYTPDDGRINIELEQVGNKARVTIADSGIGIPKEDADKVFRRFYRIESSRSEQPGNGLGLSLVLAVLNLHNADVQLSDNQPGLRVEIELGLLNRTTLA